VLSLFPVVVIYSHIVTDAPFSRKIIGLSPSTHATITEVPCGQASNPSPEMERMKLTMDLTQATAENMEYMIEAIKTKLRMASGAAMQASAFPLEKYEDLQDLYEMVMSKEHLSISEVEAVASELGKLRK